MPILGISGKRGAGKTALANYLVKRDGFIKISFAEELKRLSKTLFPFTDADFTNIKLKEANFKTYEWSPRDFMRHFGDLMRFHDKNYWVNLTISKCADARKYYVVDDLRFINEAEALRAKGAKLIRVNRFESNNPYGNNLDITSETELDDYKFDYVIEDCRNTTLAELYNHEDSILDLF